MWGCAGWVAAELEGVREPSGPGAGAYFVLFCFQVTEPQGAETLVSKTSLMWQPLKAGLAGAGEGVPQLP